MTTKTISSPPPELTTACDRIDEGAGFLLADVIEPFEELGKYESDVEARVMFFGMLRHVEAVLGCARADMVLLPAANTITRAVLEQSVKIRWLLLPPEVFDREARFLAHLSDEERMWERCARDSNVDSFRQSSAAVAAFRNAVEHALPSGTTRLPRIPKFDAMLQEIGEGKRYLAYTLLSQNAHGSHFGGNIYRRGLGTEKRFHEQVAASDWALLLEISWWSLFAAAQSIERTCARRDIRSVSDLLIEEIGTRLSRLRRGPGTSSSEWGPSGPTSAT